MEMNVAAKSAELESLENENAQLRAEIPRLKAEREGSGRNEILDALDTIKLSQTGWDDGEDIMTFNGKPIGATLTRHREIDRWWPGLKRELADFLAAFLSRKEKGVGE